MVPLFLHPTEHSIFFEQKYSKSFSCNIISNAIILENATVLLSLKSISISITVKITFYTLNIMYNMLLYYRDLLALAHCFPQLSGVFVGLKTLGTTYWLHI